MKEFLRRYPASNGLGLVAFFVLAAVLGFIPTEQGKTWATIFAVALGYGYYRLYRKYHPLPGFEEQRARHYGWVAESDSGGAATGMFHPQSGMRATSWEDACRQIDEQSCSS